MADVMCSTAQAKEDAAAATVLEATHSSPCRETQALILAELKETNDLLSNALMDGGLLRFSPPR